MPDPEGPISDVTWLAGTLNVTSRTATRPWNETATSTRLIAAARVGVVLGAATSVVSVVASVESISYVVPFSFCVKSAGSSW